MPKSFHVLASQPGHVNHKQNITHFTLVWQSPLVSGKSIGWSHRGLSCLEWAGKRQMSGEVHNLPKHKMCKSCITQASLRICIQLHHNIEQPRKRGERPPYMFSNWLLLQSGLDSLVLTGGVDRAVQPDDKPAGEASAERSTSWSSSPWPGWRSILIFHFNLDCHHRWVPSAGMQDWLNNVELNPWDQVFPTFHEKVRISPQRNPAAVIKSKNTRLYFKLKAFKNINNSTVIIVFQTSCATFFCKCLPELTQNWFWLNKCVFCFLLSKRWWILNMCTWDTLSGWVQKSVQRRPQKSDASLDEKIIPTMYRVFFITGLPLKYQSTDKLI